MAISISSMTVAYQRKPVLWEVNLEIPAGKLVGLVGPNGAGKSTLLKAMIGMVPVVSGEVLIFGKKYREVRQRVAYVPQRTSVDWDFPATVSDVVMMGTYGKAGWFGSLQGKAKDAANLAMEQVGILELADRPIHQLSGGQQQRAFLARALAQQADLFLMDEPFAAVDAATEHAIVECLKRLQQEGKTIFVVHHDLHTVPQYFDYLVLLNVRTVAAGPMETTFNDENLRRTYGGRLTILEEVSEAIRRRAAVKT